MNESSLITLHQQIKEQGEKLGFQQIGITDTNLLASHDRYQKWLKKDFQGSMHYLEKNMSKRFYPEELLPGTIRIISARIDYLPPNTRSWQVLNNPTLGYVSRYALGRDYHKLIRKRLEQLAQWINQQVPHTGYRAFCDSAPILEKAIAQKAGLGFMGKHTNLINTKAGSWFFLGEIYTNLPLPCDSPMEKNHCGSCTACLKICPTNAIIGPQLLDAKRCISYLTIELRDAIPLDLRPLMGNRIYGCDDCQLICPWNKFAKATDEKDFHPRHHLDAPHLLELFGWDEKKFLTKTEGSAIRRIGYDCWIRNIAIALGNAPYDYHIVIALREKKIVSPMVQEHIDWALEQQLAACNRQQ